MANDFDFDDDDDAPRSRRRSRDEDDAPRSRRRREDDDESPRDRDDEDDAPRSRHRGAGKPSGLNPLRFVTPGTFGIAVLLFFLPWTDLSCNGPTGKMQLVTQSGLQSAMGEYSEGEGLQELQKREERKTGKKADAKFDIMDLQKMNGAQKGEGKKGDDGPEKAPALWIYLAVLLAGTVVPVLIAANKARGMAVVGFAWFAVLLLVLQMIIGFPLANAAEESNAKNKNAGAGMGMPPGKNDNLRLEAELEDAMKMKSSYLPSYWITFFVLAATGVLGLVQFFMSRSPPTKHRHRQRRERDDDDFEDD